LLHLAINGLAAKAIAHRKTQSRQDKKKILGFSYKKAAQLIMGRLTAM
jgi:hypothetical protein